MMSMKIVNLYLLCFLFLPFAIAETESSVEIYVKGVRYHSIEEYRYSKTQKQSGLAKSVQPSKPREIVVKPNASTGTKQWEVIGYEHAIGRVMADFTQNWDNPHPKFNISSQDVENRLKALLDGRREPVLIVSGDKKLRVMSFKEGMK